MKHGFYQFLMILVVCSSTAFANGKTVQNYEDLDVSCIGEENAKNAVIYLHGMDFPELSTQEQDNRFVLQNLAAELNLRIALPRAPKKCPTESDKICWGWGFEEKDLEEVLPLIVHSRKACFPESMPYGLIGFSNGGYLLNHWITSALYKSVIPAAQWMISVGSSFGTVSLNSTLTGKPSDPLRSITFVNGLSDEYNYDANQSFAKALKKVGVDVRVFDFDGDHEFNYGAVYKAIHDRTK